MQHDLYKRIGERIRAARENLGLSQEYLADELGYTSPASLSHFETGRRRISIADLQHLAGILGLPLDYFISEQVEGMQAFRLRAHAIKPSAQEAVASFLAFAQKHGEKPVELSPDLMQHRPGVAAAKILDLAGVTIPPVLPAEVARQLKVPVFHWDFPDEVSGIFVLQEGRACIGVNINHPHVRQRFTIAHELGHLVFHREQDLFVDFIEAEMAELAVGYDHEQRELETRANQFAADLLMPMNWIRRDYQENGVENLTLLASHYEVSEQALWFRLRALKLV